VVDNNKLQVSVLGATSLVGHCVLNCLVNSGYKVNAFSRKETDEPLGEVNWLKLPVDSTAFISNMIGKTPYMICVAPIWVLVDHFELLITLGVRRLVVLSSTSRYTKMESSNINEQRVAKRLVDAENTVEAWAKDNDIEWLILRPTLIYGFGQDKNISEISRIIGMFGFFPLISKGAGLRQPVHVDDVANVCVAAICDSAVINRSYNIAGGQILTYREMVEEVFYAQGKRPRFILVPLMLFKILIKCIRLFSRYRHWTIDMVVRTNQDMLFDYADASLYLGFKPRKFKLSKKDVQLSGLKTF